MDLSYVKSLSFPLPEELEKLKGAGYFDEFKERAKYHLDRENLPEEVKKRIILEMHNADVKLREYTLTESELIEQIAEYAPGFSSEDFKKLAGDTDYIFVNGEKRYVDFSVASLFITSMLLTNWPGSTYPDDKSPEVSESRDHMRITGSAEVSIDLEFIADVDPEAAKNKKLSVHLPYLSPNGIGMSDIELVSTSKECEIAPESALQRTVHFSADGNEEQSFKVRCKAKMTQTYMSFDDIVSAGAKVSEADEAELKKQILESDLSEKAPHYVFTPFIKELSALIVGDETDKTVIAKKIFDFITHKYRYAYVYYPNGDIEKYQVWAGDHATTNSPVYTLPQPKGSDEYKQTLDYTAANAEYTIGDTPDKNTKTMVMSTCEELSSTSPYRFYASFKLVEEYERK